jgi:predicted lipid-binding transport protein (Tim44 family)
MKKLMMAILVAIIAVTVGVSSAQAKRLGGGGSFGKQSQSARQAPAQSSQAANTAKPAAPAATPPASPWRGILGGALLGLGLGALLSHFGMGGAMASMISTILMIALLAFAAMFIYRMLRKRSADQAAQPAWAGASSTAGYPSGIDSRVEPAQRTALQSEPAASGLAPVSPRIPDGFDSPAFLRHAKTYFIRLQAAWDKADIGDIREFTTPEMFAEIRLQVQERGAAANHTDVVSLEAELLGVETSADEHLASVRFSGMIKESEQAPAEPFTEIWNLSKPVAGSGGWLLAGIQQSA